MKEKDLELLKIVGQISENVGLESYVVGGYVRDDLLGIPNDDIDIVVVGSGIYLAEQVRNNLGGELNVFKNFGTAQIRFPDGTELEFVGARKESYERGSRKPICEDGTLQDDLLRRDFTINALARSINPRTFGNLVDMFNGVSDLKQGILKTPTDSNVTFSDDPLRMLRCIRFAVKLGFAIDQPVFNAIRNNQDRMHIISQERITTELNKIMSSPDPARGISLLHDSNLLWILPRLTELSDIHEEGHKNIYQHTLQVLDKTAKLSDKLWLRWAALYHDIGKIPTRRCDNQGNWTFYNHDLVGAKMIPSIFNQLKQPLDMTKYVQKMVLLHMRPTFMDINGITDSGIRRLVYDASPDIDDLIILCRSDITTKYEERQLKHASRFNQIEQMIQDLKQKDFIREFQPVFTGNDIMSVFGLKSGPLVGKIKQALKDAVLDGKVENSWGVLKDYAEKIIRRVGN